MWLIVGLGNPGNQYTYHRHNVGFLFLDFLTHAYGFTSFHVKGKKALAEGTINKTKVLALKPMAFMNLSGPPTAEVLNFYKIPPCQLVVIHDDLALEPGKIRLKKGGGTGGHNGIKSLDQFIGPDYWRLKIGIGHPGHRDLVVPYVLSNFSSPQQEHLDSLFKKISDAFPLILQKEPILKI
ncbi:MAG: aminoacyl-tRNA hydrolase [Holosporales bacterium]